MHWTEKSEKSPLLLTKTESQRLNWGKPANRTKPQNRKTAVLRRENRTKNRPNPQNRNSQRPLYMERNRAEIGGLRRSQ